jgi:lipoyl(octanoyl) transferase
MTNAETTDAGMTDAGMTGGKHATTAAGRTEKALRQPTPGKRVRTGTKGKTRQAAAASRKKQQNRHRHRAADEDGNPERSGDAQAMQIIDLGCIPYAEAVEIQTGRVQEVAAGAENTLYLLEHPKVITFGRNGGRENLHVDDSTLASMGIEVAQTTRGGNITCHFPGQLVAYPVFRIAGRPGGMRALFYSLEEVVIRTLARFGLQAFRSEGRPGVWIENRKICSIGIAMRRWTSYHGLALNVCRDVSLFDMITLCGLTDARATSLQAECNDDSITLQEVKDVCAGEFRAVFAHPPVAAHQNSV